MKKINALKIKEFYRCLLFGTPSIFALNVSENIIDELLVLEDNIVEIIYFGIFLNEEYLKS